LCNIEMFILFHVVWCMDLHVCSMHVLVFMYYKLLGERSIGWPILYQLHFLF